MAVNVSVTGYHQRFTQTLFTDTFNEASNVRVSHSAADKSEIVFGRWDQFLALRGVQADFEDVRLFTSFAIRLRHCICYYLPPSSGRDAWGIFLLLTVAPFLGFQAGCRLLSQACNSATWIQNGLLLAVSDP